MEWILVVIFLVAVVGIPIVIRVDESRPYSMTSLARDLIKDIESGKIEV